MATVDRVIPVSPATVFSVLADGWAYSNWVVGTSHMRAVGVDWPAQGSRLYHASGIWPAVIRDETVVEQSVPDRYLVLTARGWPVGQARIELDLKPEGDATRVTMTESPTAGPGQWLHNPATEAILARRNVEALDRLAALVERRATPDD